MRRCVSMAVSIAFSLCIASLSAGGAVSTDARSLPGGLIPEVRAIVESNNAFGFELFGELATRQAPSTNLAMSPLSVATALTMTANGADGDTREAMRSVLNLAGRSTGEVNRACQGLCRYLESPDADVTFQSAQSIWVDDSFELASQFRQVSEEYFDAAVASLQFDDPGSVKIINRWVEQKTDGMVRDIVDEIPRAVVAYLVNAIYFHGAWKYPFDAGQTHPAPFTLSDGSEIMCRMMSSRHMTVPYLHDTELGFQAVELPYGDSSFVATIMLPQRGSDLNALIASMNANNWKRWIDNLETAVVSLQLPKFKLESDILLNDALTSLGMGVAFNSRRADFSKMSKEVRKDLWISRAIHKAVMDVTEEGTEAGAGTVVEMRKGPQAKSLVVDRPFLFAVREVNTGAVLFLARVARP